MVKNIVVLHGWASHLANWQPFVKSLKAKGYKVYQPTMPGFGKTKTKKPWSTQDYADWLLSFLESKKLAKTILIGHSFGGQVAIQFTCLNHKKVSKLILVNSGGIRPKLTTKRAFFWILAKLGKILFSLPLIKSFASLARKLLYKAAREGDYFKASPIMKQTLTKVIKEDQKKILPAISTPTLLLWGQKDTMTPIKDGRLLHQLLPNSKLFVFKSARHGLPFTHTKKVVAKILWFISSN